MTEQDRPAFAQLLLGIGEAYGEPVSDARLELYFRALEDLPLASVNAAANVHVRQEKFFPRPAELRKPARSFALAHAREADRRLALTAGEDALIEHSDRVTAKDMMEAFNDFVAMRKAGVSREDAERGIEGLLRAFLVPSRAEPWHDDCSACEDTGWEIRVCYPDQGPPCGVRGCHRRTEHTYAVVCPCRETNPSYQRRRRSQW